MTITVRTIFSINATDRSHDFLVIRRGPAGISIEAQSREDEWESATAGPFTPEQLRAALDEVAPAGSYTRTAESRPLTPDAISADAYERGVPVLRAAPQKPSVMVAHETVRAIVAAVLTEPPARPEGAAEIEALLWNGSEDDEMTVLDAEDRRLISNYLASRGVRVVTEEQP